MKCFRVPKPSKMAHPRFNMKEYKVRQRYTQIDETNEELMSQFRTGDPMCTLQLYPHSDYDYSLKYFT